MKTAFSKDYSIITIATNKLSYVQFALNCARSVLLFNDISIYIVSNITITIPSELENKVFIIPAMAEHAAMGIGIKLYLDKYLQTENSLFIDADCICFDSLDKIFKACEGMGVACAGRIVAAGDWCGAKQAETIKDNFGLDNLIRFNGGLYYIKKSQVTTQIFDKAREIADKYDEYGFDRINNKWINEEGPLSIAMMLNNQQPIADDGQYMTDLYTDHFPQINVLKGSRLLKNPSHGVKYRPWYPPIYSPVILHFGGSSIDSYPYNSQSILLKLYYLQVPTLIAYFIVYFIHILYRSYYWLNNIKHNLTDA